MRLPRIAINNYQFTIIMLLLLLIFGLNSFLTMPRGEDPPITVPGAQIIVIYPGANPLDMEQLVATPIEEAIIELSDIKKFNSGLYNGIASISVEFDNNTDGDKKYDEVVQKINSIKHKLPENILSLDIRQFTINDVNIFQLAFTSATAEYRAMQKNAGKLKKIIEKVPGVRNVKILAAPDQEVRISLNPEKMALMNISIDQVGNAIKSNNANIPGGLIDIGNKSFNIKTSGSFNSLDEIKNTVVSFNMGKLIYLKDIADVDFLYEDNNYYARFNSTRSIWLTVTQKESTNIFDVSEIIKEKVSKFHKELPEDISLYTVFDQSVSVDKRINGFMSNLTQGIMLVGILILLAIGFRAAFIVILAIPFSILIGLGFIDILGFGLQQISIAGLVISLGLLVDNAIVVTENVARFMRLGYDRKEAAIRATSQIGWPVVSSTVTTLLAFIPIIMMKDKAGDFIQSLPVTVIATLTASLLIALTITPFLASKFIRVNGITGDKKKKKFDFQNSLKGFIEGPYRKILNFALRKNALIVFLVILVMGGSAAMLRFVGLTFFPRAEKPQFMIHINTPSDTNLDKTDTVAMYVESVLDTVEDVKFHATNVGHGNPKVYYTDFPRSYSKSYAQIFVQLYEYDVDRFYALIQNLRDAFKNVHNAKIEVRDFKQGPPIAAPVIVKIVGENLDSLRNIAAGVEQIMLQAEGAINVDNQMKKPRTDLYININKDKANMLGIPVVEIDKTIRTCFSGATVSKYRDKEGEEYNIVLRLPFKEKLSVKDFDKVYVRSLSGKHIPLRQVADIEFSQVPMKISHYNAERCVSVTSDVERGYTVDEVTQEIINKLSKFQLPPDYDFVYEGEMESRQETFGGMGRAAIIALIAIFAVLVLQFRSFAQPLIIFTAIPLAVIGSIWALYITGMTFSFTALIGLISLIGIVINNSIILVDYTNILRREGKSVTDALQQAGEVRFTPIILTTLTTIGGLLPLTLLGGPMWAPMGWTIIGGLITSTALTLIVIPVLYKIFTKKII